MSRLIRTSEHAPDVHASPNVRSMEDADIKAVVALDAQSCGVERRAVIEGFRGIAPDLALVSETARGITGFALGRHGYWFEHLGPLIAPDLQTAQGLAATVFAHEPDKAFLTDVPPYHPQWHAWLDGLGFSKQRSFVRMYKGAKRPMENPALTFAVSRPELG